MKRIAIRLKERAPMKRLSIIVAAVAVFGGAYAVSALASHTTTTVTPAKIEKQVKKLQRAVSKLKAKVSAIQGRLGCEGKVLPISDYGDDTFGYSFTNDGTNYIFTSALDITGSGDSVGAWIPVVNSACVGSAHTSKLSAVRILPSERH